MAISGNAIGWMVLLPLSIISMGAAILAIALQRSLLRSVDVYMLSLLISLFLHVSVCVGVQIHVHVSDTCSHTLCHVYVWTSFTMRASQLLSLTSLSLERSAIFRATAKFSYRASPTVALVVASLWLISILLGAIPVAGFSGLRAMDAGNKQCNFLADDIHFGLALAVVILELTLMLMTTIILLDTLLQWRQIRNKAFFKMDPSVCDVTKGTLSDVKSGVEMRSWSCDVAAAFGSCRLVCIVAGLLLVCNHLPYTVLVFTGVVTTIIPADTRRTIVVWLLVLAGFLLPNCLWLCNARYRAAYRHMLARIMCVDKKGSQVVHLEAYRRQGTGGVTPRGRLPGVRSEPSSPILDVTSPSTSSSCTTSVHYVDDIWRPDVTSDVTKHVTNDVNYKKRKPRFGAALSETETETERNGRILSAEGAMVGDPQTRQTGSRQPPDGSSHCSLKDCVPGTRPQGSPTKTPVVAVDAADGATCEPHSIKECSRGNGHTKALISHNRCLKSDSRNGNVPILADLHAHHKLQADKTPEKHGSVHNSGSKDPPDYHTYSDDPEQNLHTSRDPQLHNVRNICEEIKLLRLKKSGNSTTCDSSPDALILPSSVESLLTTSKVEKQLCRPALHSTHSTSSDCHLSGQSSKKRQQWLQSMREQWLPAAFIETLTSDGSDVTSSGFVRMRYRNFRSRFRGRAKSDGDTMEYVRKCLQSGSLQMLDMYGFKNYKSTVDRKESIVFRRRRRASVPLERHLE